MLRAEDPFRVWFVVRQPGSLITTLHKSKLELAAHRVSPENSACGKNKILGATARRDLRSIDMKHDLTVLWASSCYVFLPPLGDEVSCEESDCSTSAINCLY